MIKRIVLNDTPIELRDPVMRDKEFLRLYGKTYEEFMNEPKSKFTKQQKKDYGME